MKTKYFLKLSLIVSLVFLSFSCGKGGGGVIDSLIPDLSAAWKNTNDTVKDDEYFFLVPPASQGKASASFDGNENSDFSGSGETHSFSGSYTNSKISFTFNDGPKQGTKYSGTIKGTAPNATMTLTTPTGTITLQQHQ